MANPSPSTADTEKLEKLLRMADRPGTKQEGETAMKLAGELATRLGIVLADFHAKMKTRDAGTSRRTPPQSDYDDILEHIRRAQQAAQQRAQRPRHADPFGKDGPFGGQEYDKFRDTFKDAFHASKDGDGEDYFSSRSYQYQSPKSFKEKMDEVAAATNYEYIGDGFASPGQAFHTCWKWRYKYDKDFYILVPSSPTNEKWIFRHEALIDNIGTGNVLDNLKSILLNLDYKKVAQDAARQKAERERPSYRTTTTAQMQLHAVLKEFWYTLDPPQSPQQPLYKWSSADLLSYVTTEPSGAWSAFTVIGGNPKVEKKQQLGQSDLRVFLNKKLQGGVKLHPNLDMDRFLRFFQKNGFVEASADSIIRHFENTEFRVRVSNAFGLPSKLKTRIMKDDMIKWEVSGLVAGGFFPYTGTTFVGFEKCIQAMHITGTIKPFEVGPDAMARLLKEYNLKSIDESQVDVKYRVVDYAWYSMEEKDRLPYHIGFHKTTGMYTMLRGGKTAPMHWDVLVTGSDVARLRSVFVQLGFKPQVQEVDILEKFRQMETIVRQFGYVELPLSSPEARAAGVAYVSQDRLVSVGITYKAAMFTVEKVNGVVLPKATTVGTGNDPMKLYTILADLKQSAPCKMAQDGINTAMYYLFQVDDDSGKWIVLNDQEKSSRLEIQKNTGIWNHYFKFKKIGSGQTAAEMDKHMREVFW